MAHNNNEANTWDIIISWNIRVVQEGRMTITIKGHCAGG